MSVVPALHIAWLAGYIITFPCIFAHIWIMVCLNLRSTIHEPTNHLAVSLSFGAILEQMAVGLILVEDFVTIFQSSSLCGARAIFVRTGPAIISFTLMLLVFQGSYFTRHPGLRNCSQNNSSLKSMILIFCFSIILLLPLQFMREYDPGVAIKFKCVQVLLLDSLILDSIYRGSLFLISNIIPAIILLTELWKLLSAMKTYGMRTSEDPTTEFNVVERIQFEKVKQHRLRFMRNSCVFIFLFICYSVPYSVLDATNTPALKYPKNVKFYKQNIETLIYLLGYIVIQVYPVYMYHLNRFRNI